MKIFLHFKTQLLPNIISYLTNCLLSISNAYLGPVDAHCLSSSAVQFLPVELGSPAVVLLLRVLQPIRIRGLPLLIKVPATLVSQLWLLKKVRALALPPSCIWRNCCHVQFVSRLVDLEKGVYNQKHSKILPYQLV